MDKKGKIKIKNKKYLIKFELNIFLYLMLI